jgi:hypothetical protein
MDDLKKLEKENRDLKEELAKLRVELEEVKEKNKKYTNPERSKRYYEKNKALVIERNKKYKSTPEQRKEYNRKSYLIRKAKLAQEKMDMAENIEE